MINGINSFKQKLLKDELARSSAVMFVASTLAGALNYVIRSIWEGHWEPRSTACSGRCSRSFI